MELSQTLSCYQRKEFEHVCKELGMRPMCSFKSSHSNYGKTPLNHIIERKKKCVLITLISPVWRPEEPTYRGARGDSTRTEDNLCHICEFVAARKTSLNRHNKIKHNHPRQTDARSLHKKRMNWRRTRK